MLNQPLSSVTSSSPYHPHGDAAVYMSLVRLAQDFSLRYPLVKGQGNFGSIDGDPPAAMRYTEVKMSRLTPEMISDIDKETVEMMDNYDATTLEPTVLPSRIPNLLLNGADGIAVGMATRIPPHNLGELSDGINFVLDHCHLEKVENNIEIKPLIQKILALKTKFFSRSLPSSANTIFWKPLPLLMILLNTLTDLTFPPPVKSMVKKALLKCIKAAGVNLPLRGKAEITETKSGKVRIVISEIPYQVNKAELVQKIAQLATDKKIIGISDLRDESDRHGIRVVLEIRKTGKPKSILNKLYKYTSLQSSYSANLLALVGGVPQTLNLRQLLLLFLRHRELIVRRRTLFDLRTAYMRAHILEGLKIALDNLDAVIKTIRASETVETARKNLMEKFSLSDLQANAILEMQLRRLAALERQKIEDEYIDIKKIIDSLTAIITIPGKMITILKNENKEIKEKYADSRQTKIFIRDLADFSEEDLIPSEATLVTVTRSGYIKRLPQDTYRTQQRGGVGISGMSTKNEDEVESLFNVNTHDNLLFLPTKADVLKPKFGKSPNLPANPKVKRWLI